MNWRKLGLALACVSAVGLANANNAAAANPPIRTMGGEIFVKFIGFSAALRSELWFFGNTNPGPDQTPFVGLTQYSGRYLFQNQGSNPSVAPGKVGTLPVGSPTGNIGTVAFGGPFAMNSTLNFGLFVANLFNGGPTGQNPVAAAEGFPTRGAWFYSGLDTQNPDGRIHTVVTETTPYHYTVGFEDLCKVRAKDVIPGTMDCTNTAYTADFDFNDHVFEIYSNPEPVSMTLIGTGLVGLAGLARRRRQKKIEA